MGLVELYHKTSNPGPSSIRILLSCPELAKLATSPLSISQSPKNMDEKPSQAFHRTLGGYEGKLEVLGIDWVWLGLKHD